jgi:Family of unknown function (DUF6445)
MILELHPEMRVRKVTIGAERQPLLVIDDFVKEPERLVRKAASRRFARLPGYFPGLRTEAPLSYQALLAERLKPMLFEYFGLVGRSFKFSLCHYSLVTTPADQLAALQRIPHYDSVDPTGLATVHYLFKGALGGTAFYRHRKTGFEYIDGSRRDAYFDVLGRENLLAPEAAGYINGDTALFEQIAKEDGVFNRMLVYRRNSLHSGCIDKNFAPDPNPATGRLSINSFMDLVS